MPFNNISWPGRTASTESSSGAPKKTEGMKSRKVCVIVIATIKIIIETGERKARRNAEDATKNAETKLI